MSCWQSVIRHLGKWAFSGHYITDIRQAQAQEGNTDAKISWKRYDDSAVSEVGLARPGACPQT
jgi:hypothetical protein